MLFFCGRSEGSTAQNGLYEVRARGNWDLREVQQPFQPPKRGQGPHHHVEAAVDRCIPI